MKIQFILNNQTVNADIFPGQTLFEYLRKNGIFSVKYGSENGESGASTVLINGKTQNSSLMLMHTVQDCEIETIESFKGNKRFQKFQDAFLDEGAVQCGYCTPGMLLSIEALHREKVNPTEEDIKDSLAGNICRCTGYVKPNKEVLK
jgi:carbon-monoxide dehydrogenase small subunit